MILPAALLALGFAAGCEASAKSPEGTPKDPKAQVRAAARAKIIDETGRSIGSAEFQVDDDVVTMTVKVTGLEPGRHAIHIHEHGDCGDAGFEGAGGHFNPTGQGHGLGDEHVDGHHLGDMVNIVADVRGDASATRVIEGASLVVGAPEGSNSLLRDGGTAVVIHADPDDGHTNPSGKAGKRVACGIIVPAPPVP